MVTASVRGRAFGDIRLLSARRPRGQNSSETRVLYGAWDERRCSLLLALKCASLLLMISGSSECIYLMSFSLTARRGDVSVVLGF